MDVKLRRQGKYHGDIPALLMQTHRWLIQSHPWQPVLVTVQQSVLAVQLRSANRCQIVKSSKLSKAALESTCIFAFCLSLFPADTLAAVVIASSSDSEAGTDLSEPCSSSSLLWTGLIRRPFRPESAATGLIGSTDFSHPLRPLRGGLSRTSNWRKVLAFRTLPD